MSQWIRAARSSPAAAAADTTAPATGTTGRSRAAAATATTAQVASPTGSRSRTTAAAAAATRAAARHLTALTTVPAAGHLMGPGPTDAAGAGHRTAADDSRSRRTRVPGLTASRDPSRRTGSTPTGPTRQDQSSEEPHRIHTHTTSSRPTRSSTSTTTTRRSPRPRLERAKAKPYPGDNSRDEATDLSSRSHG